MNGDDVIQLSGHPGLAFVNSIAWPNRKLIELAGTGEDYVRLLVDASLIAEPDASLITETFGADELDEVAAEARGLRETLRPAIADWSTGSAPDSWCALVDELNDVLELDVRHDRIEPNGRLTRAHRRWHEPRQLLAPAISAVADLITTGDRGLVRKCEADVCTLWFYDRTKAHARRWCAMAVCGNRAKARAHRERLVASH